MSSVIIVEGLHDQIHLKQIYPNANIVITNGSEISKETIALIQKLSQTNEIIIFTDPDVPGERIRQIIGEAVPTAKHAFLRKKDAISKNHKKVGIEHASKECIIESLNHIYSDQGLADTITIEDMYTYHLIGMPNSSKTRDAISSFLNIGRPNAKTFLKRINMIQLSKEELKDLCQKLEV